MASKRQKKKNITLQKVKAVNVHRTSDGKAQLRAKTKKVTGVKLGKKAARKAASAKKSTIRRSTYKTKTKTTQVKTTAVKVIKAVKRTRTEYLEQEKQTFLDRFAQRLVESSQIKWESGEDKLVKIYEIVDKLSLLNSVAIDAIVKTYGLEKAYYESQVYAINAMDGDRLYIDLVLGGQEPDGNNISDELI